MLTYEVRKRTFRLYEGGALAFPNSADLTVVFQPLQPFGMSSGGGRTAVRAVSATVTTDANTGKYTIESEEPLQPLKVAIEEPSFGELELQGNELHISTRCETLAELSRLVETVYYLMPMFLNVEFADPPVIESVSGRVGRTPFRWELATWKPRFETTTQERQEERVVSSWERFKLATQQDNRRLVAALHYFQVACRLSRAGHSPWEFMSEIILNLSKVLEVLFPPTSSGNTRDAARAALRELDYSDDQIERDFLPAMVLRNEIDVGHVHLSVFTQAQLQVLHRYTESAELAFRLMLRRLLGRIQAGRYELQLYADIGAKARAKTVIERLAQHFDDDQEA